MSVSIPDFWKLLGESRLLTSQQVQQLTADFSHAKLAGQQPNAKALADWLVARNVLSRYQTTVLLAGRRGPFYFGDYKIYDRVVVGRLAGYIRAVHTQTGHPVLLQFLTGPVSKDTHLWAAAANQTLAACSIISPHVQRFFEPVAGRNLKFLVSEDLRGSTLDERLSAGRLPAAEACRIARLAAIGLAQMHASGRVHGDVRPANVLLEASPNHPGNVKLLFAAHEAPAPIDFTQQQPRSRLAAMADYLAPELAAPGRVPDGLCDIYALGCTLYTTLAGNPPFAGGNLPEKMARHAKEAIRPLQELGVPQPLAQLVAYLMAKNPAVRHQSATIAAEKLSAFVDPAARKAQPPPPPATLAGYEQLMRQKQVQLAASLPQAVSAPAVDAPSGAASPSPVAAQTDRSSSAVTPTLVATARPGLDLDVTARDRSGPTAAELLRRRSAQKKRRQIFGLVGMGIVVALAAIGAAVLWQQLRAPDNRAVAAADDGGSSANASPRVTPASKIGGSKPETGSSGKSATASGGTGPAAKSGPAPDAANEGGVQVIADDGIALWASPTAGKPVSLRCVPPDGQLFLIVRPADLLAHPEGRRVVQALGPALAASRGAWETASGLALDEIEQLIITLHTSDGKFPRISFVVKTKMAFTNEQLLAKWGNPAADEEKSQTYYTRQSWAYYIPSSPEDERTFAMGELPDIKEVAAAAGAPPVLFREMERLRRTTDAERHVTVLFYPQFLFGTDGEPLFAGDRARIRQPLEWLLGDHLQAAAASVHCGDEFCLEMRMVTTLDKEPHELAQELRGRLNQIPASLEDHFVTLSPPPYWKKLAFRYPSMVRELHAALRVGVENDQAMVNSVLPISAAHNLVLGGELLVATAPGQPATVALAPAAPGPKTIEEALTLKTTYSFDQQSLEFAMRDLAEDVKGNLKSAPFEFAIKIIGADLEKDSITRNQSVRGFKQEDKTVAEILTALVMKANPITTVKDPSETDQKLIWVIGPDPDNSGKQVILITTRTAAATKKYNLPAPFVRKKT